jgi:hypothetical protein
MKAHTVKKTVWIIGVVVMSLLTLAVLLLDVALIILS